MRASVPRPRKRESLLPCSGAELGPAGVNDRVVPRNARELAARLSELFKRDVEIVKRLRDAQRRLSQANERLWSGLHPDGFGLVYDGAAAAAIGTSEIAMLMRDGSAGRLDANTAVLEALQQAHWQIHRGFYAYQHASEERRQLAIEVGEYSQQLTQALSAAGWSAQETQGANVHELVQATGLTAQPAAVPGMIEVQLTASHFQLELYVDGYEFPEFDAGRDANALACELELDLRRRLDLHAFHSRLILDADEVASFVDQLRALEHTPDGEATFGDPDEESGDEFGITIRLKECGGTLDGFLADSVAARLSFEMIDVERSFVRDALAQFAAIVEAFPPRGDTTAD